MINIPFKGEVRVKSICIIGGVDGTHPSKVYLYKNEHNPDINVLEERKPLQVLDVAENFDGDLEMPVA